MRKRKIESILMIGLLWVNCLACGKGEHIARATPVVTTNYAEKLRNPVDSERIIEKAQEALAKIETASEAEVEIMQPANMELINTIEEMFKAARGETSNPVSEDTTEEVAEEIAGNLTEKITEEVTGEIAMDEIPETYDYVAFGNSVTCNAYPNPEGIWWSSWGMAATSQDKDYVHIVGSWLESQVPEKVNVVIADLKPWEVAGNRNSILFQYDALLNDNTDLITIQTGENITDNKGNLEGDYDALISYIKAKAPNAQILMVGELLWPSEDIEAAKRAVCAKRGITFVEPGEFLAGYEESYRSAIGTLVTGNDGNQYTIQNEIVAAHPNDEGMAKIAQLIISSISLEE